MAQRLLITWTFLFLALLFPARSQAATRVALIVGNSSPEIRSVLDLATAKVTISPGIELLERAGIDRVLAEQKLTQAGLTEAGQAIRVGKMLSADILAIIEVSADGKAALGLIIFDAKTGLRLWDAALPEGGPDKAAAGVAEGLQAAVKKRDAGQNGLRTVGFTAVRNADLPRSMDSFCDSLALLVERRLVAAPAVGVLERQRLEAVTGERALPTEAAEKQLLGSLVHLDLEVRRGPDREGLLTTVLMSDGKGKHLGKFTIPVKQSDPAAAAESMTQKICEALKAIPATDKGDPVREANRFLLEAGQLKSLQQPLRALQAAESAYALDPSEPTRSIVLTQLLIARASAELGTEWRPSIMITAKPEAIETAVVLARRSIDLRSQALARLTTKNAKTLYEYWRANVGADNDLYTLLWKISAVQRTGIDAETKLRFRELTDDVERWVGEYLEVMAKATEREPALFDTYTTVLMYRAQDLRNVTPDAPHVRGKAPDAPHATRKIIEITERWLEVAGKLPPGLTHEVAIQNIWMVLTQLPKPANYPIRWTPGPRDFELFDGLFTTMEKHAHPVVYFQGRCGHIWISLQNKKITPEEAYKAYVEVRRESLTHIGAVGDKVPAAVAAAYYIFIIRLCSFNSLEFRAAGKTIVETYDAWEGSLKFNMLFHHVISGFGVEPPDEAMAARKLALLDRTLAMIDNPKIPYFGGNRTAVKGDLLLNRSHLLEVYPQLAVKTEVPWERVQTLVDITDLKGIQELRLPTVAGTDLYMVGLGGQHDKQFMQLFRVPLSGGEPRPLGQMPIIWWTRFPPPGNHLDPAKISGCQVGPQEIYISTNSDGLYAFPRDGGPPRRIDDKQFPSEGYQSLLFHDGRLYAGLVGGYLVSIDPKTGRFDVLASSRRREKASPFDDGEAFYVPYIAADPARQRLVFTLLQGRTAPGLPNGLWSWDLKTREFKRLLETGGIEWPLRGGAIVGDRLLLSSTNKAVDFDLAHDKYTLLWSFGDPCGPLLQTKDALCQEGFRAGGSKIYRDGMLWSTGPFGRISIAKKKQELFPMPQRKDSLPTGNLITLMAVGQDVLLVSSPSTVWLITLRNK